VIPFYTVSHLVVTAVRTSNLTNWIHVKWILCPYGVIRTQVMDVGKGPHIRKVTANMFKWSENSMRPACVLDMGLTSPHRSMLRNVAQGLTLWHDFKRRWSIKVISLWLADWLFIEFSRKTLRHGVCTIVTYLNIITFSDVLLVVLTLHIPGASRFSEKQRVWNGVHSASWPQLRSYLEEIVAAPVQKTEINDRGNPFRWPRDTLYPQKLALTSPTSGGRSVGIVR
jgi:hypothetical protein